jgi:hypothetical protein
MEVKGQPGPNSLQEPHLQNTRAKWTGGVAQAVKLLLHKYKAPSSNTSPTKIRTIIGTK